MLTGNLFAHMNPDRYNMSSPFLNSVVFTQSMLVFVICFAAMVHI